ncbi:MAG: fructose-bisphosphatase class II [Acidobacteria bacterium]|nr:fructose-bisphosphatase class II [Acidobacteriota bacterium]
MNSSDLSLDFLEVVEQAAIECGHTMGQGDRHKADRAAVEAMRRTLDSVPIDGTIVIGEGERDEAPMLFIGEKVGLASKDGGRGRTLPEVDIAVDPLEGTNLCATGAPNAIAVLAASERGGLLHAPDLYMDKLVVGPSSKHAVSLDAPVAENLRAIAFARLVCSKPEHEERCRAMGITDFRKTYTSKDLASGENIVFAATGVTDGTLMKGVRFFGEGTRTSSVVMQSNPPRIRFIDTIHVEQSRMVRVRF